MANQTSVEIISRETLFWLLLTNIAIITPLYSQLTLWTMGICAICFVWRLGIYMGRVAKPPQYLVTMLAIGAAITLGLISSSIGVLSALINLLVLGYALKYIEATNRRDVRAIVLVGYFLIALTFIYNQSLWNTLHLVTICGINTCVLLSLYHEKIAKKITAKLGFTILLQSIPLAIILFVVLPRLPPLWLVPDMKTAVTGLSDEVSFGDIQRLSRSDDLAFRVTFQDTIPINAELYWRALVLENYDGQHWSQSSAIKDIEKHALMILPDRDGPKGPTVDYSIIAEPSHQHWLFGLDQAFTGNDNIVHMPDYRLYSLRAIDQKTQYRVSSAISQAMDVKLHPQINKLNLTLPAERNPQALAFADQLSSRHPDPVERLSAIMATFSRAPFRYTLTPPAVGPEQIDDFLFTNKAGYCVHYASALVYLARATGIPARMVTGYQGGEYNPSAGYVSVYQYMAHAWVEVWLKDQGWVRLDPTAMIAPQRIEQGFDATFDGQNSYLKNNIFSTLQLKQYPLFNELRLAFSSIDYYWSVWVLGFDKDTQKTLLTDLLGNINTRKMMILMIVSLGGIAVAIGISVGLFSLPTRQEPVVRTYNSIVRLCAKKGIVRTTQQGPEDFARHVEQQAPELAPLFHHFTQQYVALKYQPLPAASYKKQLRMYLKQARVIRFSLFKLTAVASDKSNT